MPLPTLDKTWQKASYPINGATALACNQQAIFALKDAFTTFASGTWTVALSSDGVSAGAADYWVDYEDLIWVNATGTAHSWVVLQQDGVNPGFQLLIDCVGTTVGNEIRVYTSWSAGFTGGTTLNRPTAADEQAPLTDVDKAWGGAVSVVTGSVNIWGSTDGQCNRMVLLSSNAEKCLFVLDRIKNPVPDLTEPYAFIWSALTPPCSTEVLCTSASLQSKILRAGVWAFASWTSEGLYDQQLSKFVVVPDDVTGEYPMLPVGLYCYTVGARGRVGQLYDVWLGTGVFGQRPITYPPDASKQFTQIHDVILPWDGSADPVWT